MAYDMGLSETDIAATLATLSAQMEYVRATQDQNTGDIKVLVGKIDELAKRQDSQRTFVMGVTTTVSLLWGVILAGAGILKAYFS